MSWSTPDLSDITQVVKGLIETAINQSSLQVGNIKVHCDSPDTARNSDGFCHLTLYLLHVGRDPHWRNTPLSGPRPQLNKSQPLSLNLSYLLTAWCDKDFVSEQRAMTIALGAIHSQPIVTQAVIQSDLLQQWLPNGEFVMSIEADTIEEMSRLWQAFTVPIRLSALIRVGIVFIEPEKPIAAPAIPPSTTNLAVSPKPAPTPPPQAPILLQGSGQQSPPVTPSLDPAQVTATRGPLIAVGGSTLAIAGNGLDASSEVFLGVPGTATEWNVTGSWRQGSAASDELDLVLPTAYADPASKLPPPPAATPLPGLYTLSVGNGSVRSLPVTVAIAPRIDGVSNPPLLSPDGSGLYAVAGAGFVSAATSVIFGTSVLASTASSTPGAGEFHVPAAGTSVSFKAPGATPSGSYPILLAVNGIAASTGWVAVVP